MNKKSLSLSQNKKIENEVKISYDREIIIRGIKIIAHFTFNEPSDKALQNYANKIKEIVDNHRLDDYIMPESNKD